MDAGRARFVAEGEMPPEAYRTPITLADLLTGAAMLAIGILSLMVVDVPAWAAAVCIAGGSLILARRPLLLWRYRRAKRLGRDFWNRIEVSDDGIVNTWRRPDGTERAKHYEWFLFDGHIVEPHRAVLWLRTPSVPGRAAEVVVLPRPLFGDDFDGVLEIVARHVKSRTAVAIPAPRERWKTIVLWLVLVGIVAVFWRLASSEP